MEIWINPDCSKCRIALDTLDAAGAEYTVRRYLDDPPTADELVDVLGRLGLEPWDLARTSEPAYAEVADLPRDAEHRAQWIEALAANPILIQRPILTTATETLIARTPESLTQALNPPRP